MKPRLVVRGAYYYNPDDDAIYIPHYTGEYYAVDCDRYLTKKDLSSRYDKKWFKEHKEEYEVYNDIKYYYAEYAPICPDNFELLSDLSDLCHQEEKYDW